MLQASNVIFLRLNVLEFKQSCSTILQLMSADKASILPVISIRFSYTCLVDRALHIVMFVSTCTQIDITHQTKEDNHNISSHAMRVFSINSRWQLQLVAKIEQPPMHYFLLSNYNICLIVFRIILCSYIYIYIYFLCDFNSYAAKIEYITMLRVR